MPSSRSDARLNSIPSSELVPTLEQLDLAARAQVPLAPGIRALADETLSSRTRQPLEGLADRLDRGEPLGTALTLARSGLSPALRVLVERGIQVGRFDTLLHWTVEQRRRSRNLQRQLWAAMAYPLLLASVAMLVGSFVLFGIAPMFANIFEDFGTALPDITQVVIAVSRFGLAYWIHGLIAMVLLLTVAGGLFIARGTWLVTQRWSGSIPLIGPLFRLAALTDFCHLLALFVEAGLPLHQGILCAGESTSDLWLRGVCTDIAGDIENGIISDSSAMAAGLPVAIAQMLRESTSAESLSEALHGLGDIYEARTEVNTRLIATFVEPFVLIFTCVGLGMVVISLFLPLFNLLDFLS